MRVAFYAPLKAPDHPVPSGDRQTARMLLAALRAGGHAPEVVSTLRTFLPHPDPAGMAALERRAAAEAERIATLWSAPGALLPDVWLTYHPFYKAPDWLGPRLARRFGMAYATAEASHAPKRADGPWGAWHAANEAALRRADLHFGFTAPDREGLERLVAGAGRIVDLPPFIDAAAFAGVRTPPTPEAPVRLVTVAMMREGDKRRSFVFLADALQALPPAMGWHLTIVGDGPARAAVEASFAPLDPRRLCWLGLLDAAAIGAVLRGSDLYVWPGFNEAYGICYLEAGAAGTPALAMQCGGIPSVVHHARTGWLVEAGDLGAYATALAMLIGDAGLRRALGDAARDLVFGERSVARAAAILDAGLRSLR